MKYKARDLTPQQWRLYEFLKLKAKEDSSHWVTHEEICEALPNDFKINHTAVIKKCCSVIQKHVIDINESAKIDKIVLYKNQTYKLASSKEEAQNFIEKKLLQKGCRILKRYWDLSDKIKNDGQVKLLSNNGMEIDDQSRARKFVETYINNVLTNENAIDG